MISTRSVIGARAWSPVELIDDALAARMWEAIGSRPRASGPPSLAYLRPAIGALESLRAELGGEDQPFLHLSHRMRVARRPCAGVAVRALAVVNATGASRVGQVIEIDVVVVTGNGERVASIDVVLVAPRVTWTPNRTRLLAPRPELRPFDIRVEVAVAEDAAPRYGDAYGDSNPVHTNAEFAAAHGLAFAPIQGLCTIGHAVAALERELLLPHEQFLSNAGWFRAPVPPGARLEVEVRREADAWTGVIRCHRRLVVTGFVVAIGRGP